MKIKKLLSLVLALVMALALAVPAFAADTVAVGDKYKLDASTATIAVADTDSDGTDDEWSITIAGQKGVLTTQTAADGDTADATTIGEWATAVASAFTGWDVSSSGTDVIFTANAANATVPTGATVMSLAPAEVDSMTGLATGGKTEIGSSTEVPTISVIIPKTGSAVLNPYQLSYTPAGGTATNDQIVSAMQFIKSASNVPLKVNINAVAKPTTGVTMATKTIPAATATKQVYMWLNTAKLDAQATDPSETDFTWPAAPVATSGIVLSSVAKGVDLKNLDLPVADPDNSTASYLGFRLQGDMTKAPTTAWTSADKVDVTLTFTFVASAIAQSNP